MPEFLRPKFLSVEKVINDLRSAGTFEELNAAIDAAEQKFNELIAIIDRLRRGGGDLPEADQSSQRSS